MTDKKILDDANQEAPNGEPPKIEFPCPDYPVKILGVNGVEFREYVLNQIEAYAPGFDASKTTFRDSSKGSFQSITVFITATGEQQLKDLNDSLRKSHLVKMVL